MVNHLGGFIRRNRLWLGGVSLVAVVAVFIVIGWQLTTTNPRLANQPVQLLQLTPVQRPPIVSANATWLPDQAQIIGVSVAGRHRAYAIDAFENIDEHVLNDLVGQVPVTIAYCNRTHCTRVYSSAAATWPLDIAVGGWVGERGSGDGGEMLLRVGRDYYFHDTGEAIAGWSDFPYQPIAFEHTTWGNWRPAHPDTDVYSGVRRD